MTRSVFLFFFLFLVAAPALASERFTILHFNDFHGKFEEGSSGTDMPGGAARLTTAIHKIQKENAKQGIDTVVLFGGDAFTGSLISRDFKGEAEFEYFKLLGLDAQVIGNHEFDFGPDVLVERIASVQHPVLSANAVWKKNGKLLTEPTTVVTTSHGTRIGLVGVTTVDTPKTTHPFNVKKLSFLPAVPTVQRYWSDLDRQSDIQIALTHQGVAADVALAKALPELEAVVGGHDHVKPEDACRNVGDTPVCQTPCFATYLGRMDFEVEGRSAKFLGSQLIPLDRSVVQDRTTKKFVRRYARQVDHRYNEVVGQAMVTLHHNHREAREWPLGDFVADATREATGAEIALVNNGSIRQPLRKGKITLKGANEILPFDNYLVVLRMKGRDVQRVLDYSVTTNFRGFLQVSGITFRVEGKRARDIAAQGKPLVAEKNYTVVINNFLLDGGDGYTMFKTFPVVSVTEFMIRNVVVDAIRKTQRVDIPPGNRIIF